MCSYPGCTAVSGLHLFPVDAEVRSQWLRALGRPKGTDVQPKAGVCELHFPRHCFANIMQVEMGLAKRMVLKFDAVPLPVQPEPFPVSPSGS